MTTISYYEIEVQKGDGNWRFEIDAPGANVQILSVQHSGAEVIYKYVIIR